MSLLNEILEHNADFVKRKEYLDYKTSVYPEKKMVIVTCMDSRLVELLPKALGLKNGDVKIVKNAGGVVMHPFGTAMRSILVTVYEFDVEDVLIIGHDLCGMASVDKSHIIEKMEKMGIDNNVLATIENSGIDVCDWLSGFECVEDSVKSSVQLVQNHPLLHNNVRVHGLIINPETGELRSV